MKKFYIERLGSTITAGSGGGFLSDNDPKPSSPIEYALDGVKSLLLALAAQDIDLDSDAIKTAIDSCLDAIENNLGD